MKSALLVLAALGVGGGAATVARVAIIPPDAAPAMRNADDHPGPDAARIGQLFDLLSRADPVLCEALSRPLGNYWSDGRDGIGELAAVTPALMAARDSMQGSVRDSAAIARLTAALDHNNACVRRAAARLLGNSAVTTPALRQLLDQGSPRVREATLLIAGDNERPELRDIIETRLGDADEAVAAMAAFALGELEDHASVEPLVRAVDTRGTRVRANAIWALGRMEDERAVPALTKALSDGDRVVRKAAVQALGRIEGT